MQTVVSLESATPRHSSEATGDRPEKRKFLSELFSKGEPREELRFWRFCAVLVGFAPLFVLLAVRGTLIVSDLCVWITAGILIVVPALVFVRRFFVVWRDPATEPFTVDIAGDDKPHLLTYLFATLLPFYRSSFDTWRDLLALGFALLLIVFLFWYLRLHYVNYLLALFRYHVYTVSPKASTRFDRRRTLILVTRRTYLRSGDQFQGRRLSDTVYWEVD